ncbi:MAG: FecCD family ABC transporter permease [Alkalispirochaetaceae bacterium]
MRDYSRLSASGDGVKRESAGDLSRFSPLVMPTLLVATLVLSLSLGRYTISPMRVLTVLWESLRSILVPGSTATIEGTARTVVLAVRLPRVLTAMLVGAALATSGATLQGLFRNPLVSPGILGVSSGAGLGASLAILLVGFQAWVVQFSAFLFGMGAVVLVMLISGSSRKTSMLMMVLAGVIVGALAEASISLVKFVADPEDTLPAIVYWLMGSLAGVTADSLRRVAPPIVAGVGLLIAMRWRINLLSLGDSDAQSLGVNVGASRWIAISAATITTAAAVSVAGVVGWVGLVVPHMSRMIVGADHRRLLPFSAAFGAVYLALIDNLARNLTTGEIPLGILNALVGAPFFAVLLRRTGGGW